MNCQPRGFFLSRPGKNLSLREIFIREKEDGTILRGKRLIIGDGKTVIANGAVAYENGKITAAGPFDLVRQSAAEDEIIDFGNATITPGLIDMHVHVANLQSRPDGAGYTRTMRDAMAGWELEQALTAGITALRDLSSPAEVSVSLRRAAGNGFLDIPLLFTSGRALTKTGGHAWPLTATSAQTDGIDGLRRAIRESAREGVDIIKVLSDYSQEELSFIVREAHSSGLKTAIHTDTPPALEMAVEAGFDTVEHGVILTDEIARKMIEKNIAWVPTAAVLLEVEGFSKGATENAGISIDGLKPEDIGTFIAHTYATNPKLPYGALSRQMILYALWTGDLLAWYRQNLGKYFRMGVTILAGTDMVGSQNPMTELWKELRAMTESGLSQAEAIHTATGAAGKALGMDMGLLRPGALANIAVFDGDAAADISCIQRCSATYLIGRRVYG